MYKVSRTSTKKRNNKTVIVLLLISAGSRRGYGGLHDSYSQDMLVNKMYARHAMGERRNRDSSLPQNLYLHVDSNIDTPLLPLKKHSFNHPKYSIAQNKDFNGIAIFTESLVTLLRGVPAYSRPLCPTISVLCQRTTS
jgi:hypothetical protein